MRSPSRRNTETPGSQPPCRRAIAHISCETAALVAYHGHAPAAARGEAALHVGWIGAGDDEGGAIRDVRVDAVETIRPERAVRAGAAHVVDHEKVALCAEQLRQAHRAFGCGKFIVMHRLRLYRSLCLAHLLAQFGDLSCASRRASPRCHDSSWRRSILVLVVPAHPFHRIAQSRFVAALRRQIQEVIGAIHHVEAARVGGIGVVDRRRPGPCRTR